MGKKTKEQTSRLNKISASLTAWQNCIKEDKESEGGLSFAVVANDHTYHRSTQSERDADVPIEEATQRFTDKNNWRKGRRIVELDVLAQGYLEYLFNIPMQLASRHVVYLHF